MEPEFDRKSNLFPSLPFLALRSVILTENWQLERYNSLLKTVSRQINYCPQDSYNSGQHACW
jgi:hypothetical protein